MRLEVSVGLGDPSCQAVAKSTAMVIMRTSAAYNPPPLSKISTVRIATKSPVQTFRDTQRFMERSWSDLSEAVVLAH